MDVLDLTQALRVSCGCAGFDLGLEVSCGCAGFTSFQDMRLLFDTEELARP